MTITAHIDGVQGFVACMAVYNN